MNGRCGREVVSVLGHMPDPRAVYCAADVVIGMGTSLLRGMATAKPCVLVGERSLVTVVRPETVGPYLRQGFWVSAMGRTGPPGWPVRSKRCLPCRLRRVRSWRLRARPGHREVRARSGGRRPRGHLRRRSFLVSAPVAALRRGCPVGRAGRRVQGISPSTQQAEGGTSCPRQRHRHLAREPPNRSSVLPGVRAGDPPFRA